MTTGGASRYKGRMVVKAWVRESFPKLALAGTAWLVLLLPGCDASIPPLDPLPARTLGEIVYTESCERVAYSGELDQLQAGQRSSLDASGVGYRPTCNAPLLTPVPPPADGPPILTALFAQRQALISAVNSTVPASLQSPLNLTLNGVLPALDGKSGRQAVVGSGSVLIGLAADPLAVAAIARLGWRDGFRPPGSEASAVRGVLNLSGLYPTLAATLPLLWPSGDDRADATSAAAGQALLRALGRELTAASTEPSPGDPARTLALALRFLLSENAELKTLPTGQSSWAVLRDFRGVAQINTPGNVLPAPFVADAAAGGLAKLDSLGHFVSSSGTPLPDVPPFPLLDPSQPDRAVGRDSDGRALLTAGSPTPLYRYLNLDDTVLAGLFRDAPTLLDPGRDIPFRLVAGVRQLLGPRQPSFKDYAAAGLPRLDYSGFDTTQAPLLDLAYSFIQLLGYSDAGTATGSDLLRLLRGVYLLLRDQESPLSRSLAAVAKSFDEAKKPAYAAAELSETSTLYDDLLPVLVRLLRTSGLLSDVLSALTDPAAADLGPLLTTLMTDSSYFFMNQNQLDATQPNATLGSPGKPVNRAAVDSDVDYANSNGLNNRSAMQRVLHLVHDANGMLFCNKPGAQIKNPVPLPGTYQPCELLQIDDLAVFYVLTMASRPVKDSLPEADFLNAIKNSTLSGLMRAGGGLFLSNMLGIPGFNFVITGFLKSAVYPTPEAASRLLFQTNSMRSGFQQDALDLGACSPKRPGTLCCNQNHSWAGQHDGALFALESLRGPGGHNFYQAISPVVDAFAKHTECIGYDPSGACRGQRNAAKILVDLLSVLHRHWPTAQSTFYRQSYESQSRREGVSHYEPLVAQLVDPQKSDLWPAALALLPALLTTKLDDGSNLPVATVVASFARWLLDPQAPRLGGALLYHDGRSAAKRSDGQPTFAPTLDPVIGDVLSSSAQGQVTPYDLLADAYKKKRARLAQDPSSQTGWQGGVSSLADVYLTARTVSSGSYKFSNPRGRSIELAAIELLQSRVAAHAKSGDLQGWVKSSLYRDLAESLSGPVTAGLLDVLSELGSDPAVRQQLPQLLGSLLGDPGPGQPDSLRFAATLRLTADLLQLLLDDGDVLPVLRQLGLGFAAENGAVDGALAILRRSLPADPQQVLLQVGRNLFQPAASGLYPAFQLRRILDEVDRADAGQPGRFGTPLDQADYQSILKTVGQFLRDEQRGGARLIDIIQSRPLPAP